MSWPPPACEPGQKPALADRWRSKTKNGTSLWRRTPCPQSESVDLSEKQLGSLKIEFVGEHTFPIEKRAVGSIDFNEDMSVQVFTPYQGKIISLFAKIGDEVKKGQTLFTIDSPDLLQAESTLIAAAGVLELADEEPRTSAQPLQAKRGGAAGLRAGRFPIIRRRRAPEGRPRRRPDFRENGSRNRQDGGWTARWTSH